jgi:hypothetical protein
VGGFAEGGLGEGPGPSLSDGREGPRGEGEELVTAFWSFLERQPAGDRATREEYADLCLRLVRAHGGIEQAVRAVRSVHPGRGGSHLDPGRVARLLNGRMSSDRYHLLVTMLTEGVTVRVDEPPAESNRGGTPVPPHGSARGHEEELWTTVWKDVLRGGALVLPLEEAKPWLHEVEFSPLGRVEKKDHLGRPKATGRLIHDISYGKEASVNHRTIPDSLPEMKLCTLGHIIRSVLYWKDNTPPGTRICITKRDVDAAFRRIPVRADGVRFFAAVLRGLAIILLVLTFGWCGSPPVYGVASEAISVLHRSHRPANPERDGEEPFESHTYIDDGNLIEPDIGKRLEQSAQCYEDSMVAVLGPGAVSQDKKEAEGQWSTVAITLGIEVNTTTMRLGLPAPKLERLLLILDEERLKDPDLLTIQTLVGRLISLAGVFPPAKAFLSGLIQLLGSLSRREPVEGAVWESYQDDLFWLRVIVRTVASWSVPLSVPAAVALSPGEWMRHGAGGQGYVYVGADATEWSFSAVNMTAGEFIRGRLTTEEHRRLRRDVKRGQATPGPPHIHAQNAALYIGVVELAALVYSAMKWGHQWKDKMVVFITDSLNALGWVRRGRARNRLAAHLLRLLARLQLRWGFQVWAERVSSEENEVADCLTRTWRSDGSLDECQARRWRKIEEWLPRPLAEVYLSDQERGANVWLDLRNPVTRGLRLPGEEEAAYQELVKRGESPPAPGGGRCGGGPGATREEPVEEDESSSEDELPKRHREPGNRAGVDRSSAAYQDTVQRETRLLLEESVSAGTRDQYYRTDDAFRRFCQAWGRPHRLDGHNPREDERTLMLYAVDQGLIQGIRASTIRGHLSAIRWNHLIDGFPDPNEKPAMLPYLLQSLERRDGAKRHRDPVTLSMLHAARRRLDLTRSRDRLTWAAVLTGFGFLLRASEYLASQDGQFVTEKAARWQDITFYRAGMVLRPDQAGGQDPDEVVLHVRASKTDQLHAGKNLNLRRSGVQGLCPVLQLWAAAQDQLREGPLEGYVFQEPGKRGITRGEVTVLLRQAALDAGFSGLRLDTHSLRAGGATAMWAAGFSEEEIMAHGRWLTRAFLAYIHRSVAASADVARDIFTTDVRVLRHREEGRSAGLGEARQHPARAGMPSARGEGTSIPPPGEEAEHGLHPPNHDKATTTLSDSTPSVSMFGTGSHRAISSRVMRQQQRGAAGGTPIRARYLQACRMLAAGGGKREEQGGAEELSVLVRRAETPGVEGSLATSGARESLGSEHKGSGPQPVIRGAGKRPIRHPAAKDEDFEYDH